MTTRIWVMSDIHDDYSRKSLGNLSLPRDVEADVIVVAGDIAGRLSKMGRTWLEAQNRGIPMVVVPGNHCFWRASLDNEIEKFRDNLQVDWIHVLDGDTIKVAGARFVGGTLWTDYECWDNGHVSQVAHVRGMRDFDFIRTDDGRSRLTPRHLGDIHDRHRAAIEATLATPSSLPTVVVTHHAPSPKSLRNGFANEPLDAAYASDLESLIHTGNPDLWIHGHVHARQDYMVGETRIVANPRGYLHAAHARLRTGAVREHEGFDPRFVVTVEPKPRPLPDGFKQEGDIVVDPYGLPAGKLDVFWAERDAENNQILPTLSQPVSHRGS